MPSIVDAAIDLDDAPMERFLFFGAQREGAFEVDAADGARIVIVFSAVVAVRLSPMFDRRQLMIDGVYRKTVLQIDNSSWLVEMRQSYAVAEESFPQTVKHYVVPSDDGVWELLASRCFWKRA